MNPQVTEVREVGVDAQKLVDDLKMLGQAGAQSAQKGVDAAKREYKELEAKHPGFGSILARTAEIVITVFSFLVRPVSTVLGFAAGLAFSKDVKNLKEHLNEWFKGASPVMKTVGVAAAFLIFMTPILGGFSTGAHSGQKVADWLNERAKAQVKAEMLLEQKV